jgi:hypothetical protein
MIKLNDLLNEVKVSTYVNIIKDLIKKIDWLHFKEFIEVKDSSLDLLSNIENIGEYEGENAKNELFRLKEQCKDFIYILQNLLDNQEN